MKYLGNKSWLINFNQTKSVIAFPHGPSCFCVLFLNSYCTAFNPPLVSDLKNFAHPWFVPRQRVVCSIYFIYIVITRHLAAYSNYRQKKHVKKTSLVEACIKFPQSINTIKLGAVSLLLVSWNNLVFRSLQKVKENQG